MTAGARTETETVERFATLARSLEHALGPARDGAARRTDVLLGIGDDAALLRPPPGEALVACVDTLNEGTHFLGDQPAGSVGHRALAVNLSDLAAMGAEPRWVLLSLSLPEVDAAWVDAFAEGFGELAREHRVALVGGDVTRGARAVSVTALGAVPADAALRRGTAAVGDRVWVSGTLGGAALGLREPESPEHRRLLYPTPRVALGLALRGLASACIDLSDGLAADLPRLAPGQAVELDAARLPLPRGLVRREDGWRIALAGGDDYELCFCAPPAQDQEIERAARAVGTPVTAIGIIASGGSATVHAGTVRAPDGSSLPLAAFRGFEHFP